MALAVTASLVAVAVGGGVGLLVLSGKDKHDDSSSSATRSKEPSPSTSPEFGVKPGGSHFGPLRKHLISVPDGYALGPDVEGLGNDTELAGGAARQAMKETYGGLPKKQREAALKFIDSLDVQRLGVRSYRQSPDGWIVVEMRLIQMGKDSAKKLSTSQARLFKALGIFRNGPKIKGFEKARCFLPPNEPGAKLDSMLCFAAEGDLLVTMTSSGVAPLRKQDAAELLKQQLERIEAPGAIV